MSEHTISELAALSGLPVRTIRYYVAEGLIPSSGMEGPGTRYPDATLARLRVINKLKDAHLPLAEIRKRLQGLEDEEVQGLSGRRFVAEPAGSALDYIRSVLGEGKHRPEAGRAAAADSEPAAPLALNVITLPLETSAAPASPPEAFERSRWERVVITPDIEVHIRRPLSRRDIKMVERLLAFARQLQGEETQ